MANKILQGTVDYYIRGQYGILKGDDGKLAYVGLNMMIKLFVQVEEEIQKIHQIVLLEYRLNRD